MLDTLSQRIAVCPHQAGEARWWFGGLALIKLTGAQTEGRFSLIEVLYPPNREVPLHIHNREDETFHVLEGTISYRVGTLRLEATAGHTLFAPRGVPHGFTVLSPKPAHYLIVYSPAGFEEFIRESSIPANTLSLPPNPYEPVDPSVLKRIGLLMSSKYGCEFVT